MTSSGIGEHGTLRERLGANIQRARNEAGLSRNALVARLCESRLAPKKYTSGDYLLKSDTLKQWELGRNPVHLDWLPALCEVLDCDSGFLFGEYPQRHRITADVCETTGLSETAVGNLKAHDYFYRVGGERVSDTSNAGLEPSAVLSRLLENEKFWRVIGNISMWTKTAVQELFELADQYDPLSGGLPMVPGYMEPNPAKVPFEKKNKTADLLIASASRHFGDAVEKIFEDLCQKK